MAEKNLLITEESDEVRKCIVAHLQVAKEILEGMGKECGVDKIWYLAPGLPVEKIEEVIFQLSYIIKRIASVVPEATNRKPF